MELLTEHTIWTRSAVSEASAPMIALFFALLFLELLVFGPLRQKYDTKYPPYAPGGLWKHTQMRMSSRSLPYWFLDIADELQTRVFQICLPIFPPKTLTAVGEPSTCRAILTDPRTKKPARIYGFFRNIYMGTPTVFTMNGPEWHAKRKALAPAFASKHVRWMTEVALARTEAWLRDTVSTEGASFDVGQQMVDIVLSALAETALEYDLSDAEKELFGEELRLAMTEFVTKTPVMPLRNAFGRFMPERRRAMAAARKLRALVTEIMRSYREKGPTHDGTLIQLIMESEAFPTEDEKAAQLLEFLVAGHDTTAYSIAFTLLELARNPREQTKLRESLRAMPRTSWANSECLKCVVKEGMRLHPVGRSMRVAGSDTRTSRNKLVPKGALCINHFLLLFRNPDIFAAPASFLPSRWENPSREMLDAFNPFSLGKQNCVGQSLARAEMYGIIARICSELELTVECEGRVDFCLTVKPVGARLRARRVAW